MLHRPADVFVDKVLARFDVTEQGYAASLGVIALKLAAAIAFASASWYAFEKPILRLKARFEAKGHPAANAPEAAPPSEKPQLVPVARTSVPERL